jgi:hypothetical protein
MSPGFITNSATISDPDHLFSQCKSCTLSRRELRCLTPSGEKIQLLLCDLGVSGTTGMQFETESASVDLARSQLNKTPNGWIERTACKVTGQPEDVAVGVWIGGIGVEAHHPDGMRGDKSVGGMPMTSDFHKSGDRRFRLALPWFSGLSP